MNRISEENIDFLKPKKLILHPTDTTWGLGCECNDFQNIDKIISIKQKKNIVGFVLLMKDVEMVSLYTDFEKEELNKIFNSEKKLPTTFVLPFKTKENICSKVINQDKQTIAVRIPKHDLCQKIINLWSMPIVSTSANLYTKKAPSYFKDIDSKIVNSVDFFFENKEKSPFLASQIISIDKEGEKTLLREVQR